MAESQATVAGVEVITSDGAPVVKMKRLLDLHIEKGFSNLTEDEKTEAVRLETELATHVLTPQQLDEVFIQAVGELVVSKFDGTVSDEYIEMIQTDSITMLMEKNSLGVQLRVDEEKFLEVVDIARPKEKDGWVQVDLVKDRFDNENLMERLKNDGLHPEVVAPESFDELVQIIEAANRPIRAMGTQYGFGDTTFTSGVLIDMTKHLHSPAKPLNPALLSASARENIRSLHQVQSGSTLQLINEHLWPTKYRNTLFHPESGERFRMFANAPGYDQLSVGGLVSVGAQGTGIMCPSCPDQVRSLLLITIGNEGKLRKVQIDGEGDNAVFDPAAWEQDRENHGIELLQSESALNAVLGSAGCTGVIYSMILKVKDACFVSEDRKLAKLDHFLETMLPDLLTESSAPDSKLLRIVVWVNPYRLMGEYHVVYSTYRQAPDTVDPADLTTTPPGPGKFGSLLAGIGTGMISHYAPRLLPLILQIAAHSIVGAFEKPLIMTDILSQSMGYVIDNPATDAAWGIPGTAEVVAAATKSVLRQLERLHGDDWSGPVINSPFGLNFACSGRGYLTLQHGRPTCMIEMPIVMMTRYIDLLKRNKTPKLAYDFWIETDLGKKLSPIVFVDPVGGWQETFDGIRHVLVENFDESGLIAPARQHLGFPVHLTAELWVSSYGAEEMGSFVRFYREFNVSRLFCNKFTRESGLDSLAGFSPL